MRKGNRNSVYLWWVGGGGRGREREEGNWKNREREVRLAKRWDREEGGNEEKGDRRVGGWGGGGGVTYFANGQPVTQHPCS